MQLKHNIKNKERLEMNLLPKQAALCTTKEEAAREILFRGKRESDGRWLYGLYSSDYVYETDFPCIMPLRTEICGDDWSIIPRTVGQYIGQADKNGEKIFEWDVVYNDEFDDYGVVLYAYDRAKFVIEFSTFKVDFDGFRSKEFEIVGNIYDNPELLEDK